MAANATPFVYSSLQALPPAERIVLAPAFAEPLVWTGSIPPSSVESEALWAALVTLYAAGPRAGFAAIEEFLKEYPDSAWAPAVRHNLACSYERRGRYAAALGHWEQAWEMTRWGNEPSTRGVADAALTGWSRLLAGLGQIEKLEKIIGAVQGRQPSGGRLRMEMDTTVRQYLLMRLRPEGVFKCGALAVMDLARDPARPAGLLRAMMMTKAPAEGFSLAGLSQMAASYGYSPRIVRWQAPGTIPVPSVAHLSVGHFVAVTATEGDRVLVEDAGLQRKLWMAVEELTPELSGYFLVAGGAVPAGCEVVPQREAEEVQGRGVNNSVDDLADPGGGCESDEAGDDPTCPPEGCLSNATGSSASGGAGSGAGCATCGPGSQGNPGLPEWSVSEPYLNVWLTASPLSYSRADGSAQTFTFRYQQRNQRPSGWVGGFGPNWEANRLSYIERDGLYTDVSLYAPGGGRRRYLDPQSRYFHYEGSFEYRTRSRMECDYDANGQATAYRVIWPNGATNTYGLRFDIWSEPTRFFLTAQSDPSGRTTTYSYSLVNSHVHLTAVQDRDGVTTSFIYGNGAFPHHVTLITNTTRGLGAQLTYDIAGRLTVLINALGVSSSFAYGANNWVEQMTTPLGTTAFQLAGVSTNFTGDPAWAYNRSALITEADGTSKHLFVYRDGSHPAADPLNLLPAQWPSADWPVTASNGLPDGWGDSLDGGDWMQYRNSYYWNPNQYHQLNASFRASNGNLSLLAADDFIYARLRHWLHQYDPFGYVGQGVTDTLSMQRDPSPDGLTAGQTTWYDYDDLEYGSMHWEDTFSRWPALIARVMPDGTSWATRLVRNLQGHITQRIEFWRDSGFNRFRTNRFEYAANGVDLIAHFGPGDQFEAGYAYDTAHPHLPVAITNAVGEVTRHYYDSAHRLTGTVFPSGAGTTNFYVSGRLERTVEFLGATPLRTNSFSWLNGFLRTHTDPRGLTRTFTRDALGRVTRVDYSADGTSETFSYVRASDGQVLPDVTQHVDRRGKTNRYTYTALRRLETHTDPLGRVTRYTYCACGGPDTVTRAHGSGLDQTTSYAYDLLGRTVLVIQPDGTAVTNWFDRLGRLIAVQRPYGSTTHTYDNLSRLEKGENAAGTVSELAYDDHDRILWQTDSHGVTVTNAYDALGRLLRRVTLANNATESWGYTAGVSGPTSYTNQLGHVTRFEYDVLGRKTLEAQVGVFTNQFTYTPAGDLATLADGKGNVTTWKYDAEGRVTEKWYQGQSTADLLYSYNANGWLAWRFTRTGTGANTNGYFTTYTYDAVGNLLTVTYPGGTASITNQYDALDRLTNRLDGLGQTRYTYAVLGNGQRTFTEDGPWASDEVTVTNRYGLRSGLRLAQPSGAFAVSYAWDAAGRWSVVGGPAGTFSYSYPASYVGSPAWTLPTALTLPGGGSVTNTYDALARLTRTDLRTSGGAILNAHGYQYDLANQRTLLGRTNSAYPSWNGYVLAGYDPAGQLTNAWTYLPDGTPVTAQRWSYGYNPAQNLTRRTNNVTVETFTVNALNQLTAIPDSTPTYDRRGNLTQRAFSGSQMWYYTYDHENQLTRVQTDEYYTPEASRWKVEFVYDGQGRLRVKRDYVWSSGYGWYPTGETRYLYDLSAAQAGGLLLVLERNSANTPTVTYTRGRDLSGSLAGAGGIGGLLARSHGYSGGNWTSHTAYHADGNGNVTALANSAGALQASYRYDPYGRYLAGGGPLASANGLRFSSKPWVGFAGSATSGLYYYGYRFYDPYLQRWVNRDPANEPGFQMLTDQFRKGQIHDLQLHLFVKNNPISNWDYLGLDNPGCDLPSWLQPSGANKDCYLRCCAQHDACYYRNDCTAASWGFNVAEVAGTLAGGPVGHGIAAACLIFSKCAGCNNEVMGCFARCASGIKPPRGPRWFCPNGKHAGEWYDDWDKIPADCWETGKKPDHP